MNTISKLGVLCIALTAAALPTISKADTVEKSANTDLGVLAAVWSVSVKDNSATFVLPESAVPVTVKLSTNTILGGICTDCGQFQPFKLSDAAKTCKKCACGSQNADCVAWTELKTPTWDALLESLPPGVGIHLVYNDANNPATGLKSLSIDRKIVLLPVVGLDSQTPAQLMALVKPVGGVKAQLLGKGKYLEITLKTNWTLKREAAFANDLSKAGAKISHS